jgi:hypothetical protein
MMSTSTGNQITNNAIGADDAGGIIERAIAEVCAKTGWRLREEKPLYSGYFYDRKKVGSFIVRVINDRQEVAVLKLQLRPLAYDEGMVIRHVQSQIRTNHVRLPILLKDEPWEEGRGYGYLLMEDASEFNRLWKDRLPTEEERKTYTEFLDIFMHDVLPIEAFLPMPETSLREKYQEGLTHFSEIARVSTYHHIEDGEVERMKTAYSEILGRIELGGSHFTHGHLSGMDVFRDPSNGTYVLFSNLMWSFRPTLYEVIFPFWVDVMGIRDKNVSADDVMERVYRWAESWKDVMQEDPLERPLFWFLVLERSMMTVMLDLGASQWLEGEIQEKQALLNAWKDLFWKIRETRLKDL